MQQAPQPTGFRRRQANELGAATVDFALIGGLLTVIFIAIVQLTLVLHVRNTLIDAASSGARYGTLADRSPADAASRTHSLITGAINSAYAQDVSVRQVDEEGVPILQVTIRAPIPVIGLIGPSGTMEVTGRAALPS